MLVEERRGNCDVVGFNREEKEKSCKNKRKRWKGLDRLRSQHVTSVRYGKVLLPQEI